MIFVQLSLFDGVIGLYTSLSAGVISSYKSSPFADCVNSTLAVPTPLAFLIAVDVCVKFI